jgi:hypothetical protein
MSQPGPLGRLGRWMGDSVREVNMLSLTPMFKSRLVWLLPLAALSVAQQSDAGLIIDVGSGGPDQGPAVQSGQYVQQKWTQTQGYTDVDISVVLFSWTLNVPFHVSAFLTPNTGPSATPPALASTSFTGVTSDNTGQRFQLFSGLTLGPGTYYLTLSGTDVGPQAGAVWSEGPLTPTFLDTGITLAAPGFCTVSLSNSCTPNAAYAPASVFNPGGFPNPVDFRVEAVPEPSTVTMMLSAMASIFFIGLKRRNRYRQG